jgi:hypothetical protein
MKRLSKIVLAASLLATAPALAQEGPVASAGSTAVDSQIRDYLDAAAAPLPASGGAVVSAPREAEDKAPHGEFSVGVGSNGYRHADASTVLPLGNIGTAAVAVSDTRFNGRFGPRKQQSLSVAVALGEGAGQPRPGACGQDRLSGRALEPMWVTRMRAAQPTASLGCAAVDR